MGPGSVGEIMMTEDLIERSGTNISWPHLPCHDKRGCWSMAGIVGAMSRSCSHRCLRLDFLSFNQFTIIVSSVFSSGEYVRWLSDFISGSNEG